MVLSAFYKGKYNRARCTVGTLLRRQIGNGLVRDVALGFPPRFPHTYLEVTPYQIVDIMRVGKCDM